METFSKRNRKTKPARGSLVEQRPVRGRKLTGKKLQSAIDELKASNEKLRAAHRKTIRLNAALQHANEELSVINAQLHMKMERHDLILSGIKEYGIFMLDCEGRFTVWTAGAERILGYPQEEVLGQHLSVLHLAEDREAGRAERDLARAEVDGSVEIERWHLRKDGSQFWATGTISVLRDERGRTEGFVKVIRDNTDHKRAEDLLREAMVTQNGNQLGPLGGRIVAETFVRMLKRDSDSFLNVPHFTPSLPSSVPGTFMIADLLEFAGVLVQ